MNKELAVDLSPLRRLLDRMGGEEESVETHGLTDSLIHEGFIKFDWKDFGNIEIANGALSWGGAQVAIYLYQPHNSKSQLENGGEGVAKFHITDCETVRDMREGGRKNRYIAHRLPSEPFPIRYEIEKKTKWGTKKEWSEEEIFVNLWACKNCMYELDLPDDDSDVKNFDRVEFFKNHESNFPYEPKYDKNSYPVGGYPDNWDEISKEVKEKNSWCCDCCKVNLSRQEHRKLLHTHHKDGILRRRGENNSNLRPLCILCHSRQPYHRNMATKEEKSLIEKLRTEQGLPSTCYECPPSPHKHRRYTRYSRSRRFYRSRRSRYRRY